MPNITKYLCLLVLFLYGNFSYAQELILSTLNLNEGGYINEVYNDEYSDSYIVVGNFSTVNGFAHNNIVFIDRNNLERRAVTLFTQIDGEIESVAVHRKLAFGTSTMSLYLGGAFENINDTIIHKGIVKYSYFTAGIPSADDIDSYTRQTWDPEFVYAPGAGWSNTGKVKKLLVVSDTLFVAGNFVAVDDASLASDNRPLGVAAFNINTNADFTTLNTSSYSCFVNDIHYRSGQLYISGTHSDGVDGFSLGRYNLDGTLDLDFGKRGVMLVGEAGLPYGQGFQLMALGDSAIALFWSASVSDDAGNHVIYRHDSDPPIGLDAFADHFYSNSTSNCFGGGDQYKDVVYLPRDKSAYVFSNSSVIGLTVQDSPPPPSDIEWNGFMDAVFDIRHRENIFVVDNIMFISGDDLDAADQIGGSPGLPRNGLAMYCLEPQDTDGFLVFDTTICQTNLVNYVVSQAEFAEGYIWEYTGTGVDINNTGAPENLSDTLFNDVGSAWNIDIQFKPWFTPGELRVTPFTTCNNMIEGGVLVTSNTVTINIDTNPLPDANAGEDVALTCAVTEATLMGTSITPDVTFSWNFEGGGELDIVEGTDYPVDDAGDYILTVLDGEGCLNFDTVNVFLDTIRPNFDPIAGPFDLTCSDTSRNYLGFCNNLTDTTSFWVSLVSGDTSANPIAVSLPGVYQFYTINNENGCIDSTAISVYLNQPSPNIKITDYDELPVDTPLDTINCYNPSLTLECYSDTASTILNWVEADSSGAIGPIVEITEAGNYYILAQNTENGCFNYTGVNIAGDFAKPNVELPIVSSINCSNDSLVLNGSTIFLDTIMEWTGDGIIPSANPVTIFDAGTYYLTITKNDNGCSEIDSLTIIADNSIDVFAGNDTTVCDESLVFLTASYGGDISGISYLWNNGTADESAFYTGGTDSFAVVEVFGDDDCYGFDTLFIAIPPVPVVDFEAFQPCGEGATGSIIASPVSGLAPFEYSVDGGVTFQVSSAITGLDFGTYTIWVKDSLDCLYEYSATIDESSDLPQPEFLFSTYNFQMDTVIVVDVSNPPTDSVNWVFSDEILYIGESDGAPLIVLPDTGSFTITMDAFYGECLVSVTKEIYVSEFDSTFATANNQNGIASINLYPNPTTGLFTAEITFYKKQRVAMAVQDMLGYIYEERNFEEVDTITEDFELELDAVNGTYVLRIISEYDAAYITFVLSR